MLDLKPQILKLVEKSLTAIDPYGATMYAQAAERMAQANATYNASQRKPQE